MLCRCVALSDKRAYPASFLTDARPWAGIWEVIVDASLWLDMVLNFRTAFSENTVHVDAALVTSYHRIGLEYLRGFLALDVISTVPWDLVNESLGLTQLFKISKVGKLVRVMRMLKITKMLRVVKV